MYDRFFTSLENDYIEHVGEAIADAGYAMPMLQCSPDFTNPSAAARQEEIEREARMVEIARKLGGPGTTCRVLTGQRYPEVAAEQGFEWIQQAFNQLLPVAQEYDVILALENHYKDHHWLYPEFAQMRDRFLQVLALVPASAPFGVQYDPSNALLAGDDPIDLLDVVVDRVVSVHASDRFLEAGATLDELRQSDGTIGYSPRLRHGVVGRGLIDYQAVFRRLSAAGYTGWVSVEDGLNGLGEIEESLLFLETLRSRYFEKIQSSLSESEDNTHDVR